LLCTQSPPHPLSTLLPYTTLFRSGLPLAARLSIREAVHAAERHGALHAMDVRQLGRERPQPGASAEARAMGTALVGRDGRPVDSDRKSTRLNSSHVASSYAVFCLK